MKWEEETLYQKRDAQDVAIFWKMEKCIAETAEKEFIREKEVRMFCSYCGKKIPDDSEFCPMCGNDLRENVQDSIKYDSSAIHKEKAKTGKIIIVAVLAVMIAGAGIGSVFLLKQFGNESLKTEYEKAETQSGQKADEGNTTVQQETQEPEEDVAEYDPTEGGIHRYEFVVEDVTWEQAFENCQSKGGYLARINSEEEYQYILNELNSQQLQNVQFFIGGRRDTDSEAYYWVDENNLLYGEQINVDSYWVANEWLDGEPSFRDGDIEEQYLDLLYHKNSGRWTWNDAPNDILSVVPEFSGRIGYICEYED